MAQKTHKLYQKLPRDLQRDTPLSLLLATVHPYTFSEFPLGSLLALELPEPMRERYDIYSAGTSSS